MTKRQTKAERYLSQIAQEDPLVPFRRERLDAAIELGNYSQAAIAKRLAGALGVKGPSRPLPRQAINRLLNGEGPKRIRRRYRRALAEILEVPEQWLSGEEVLGPETSLPNIDAGIGRRPRAWLALHRFVGRVEIAVRRDAKKASAAVSHDEHMRAVSTIAALVGQLLRFARLRAWLLPGEAPDRPIHSMEDYWALQKPNPDDPELENAELAVLRALNYLLSPWFANRSALDYEQLRIFANAFLPPGHAPDKHEARGSDSAGLPPWVIERRETDQNFTTPARLGEDRNRKTAPKAKKR
jgi:transcriptional regulator with XRE-family HTH domain